jgi:hypothetical protein
LKPIFVEGNLLKRQISAFSVASSTKRRYCFFCPSVMLVLVIDVFIVILLLFEIAGFPPVRDSPHTDKNLEFLVLKERH